MNNSTQFTFSNLVSESYQVTSAVVEVLEVKVWKP